MSATYTPEAAYQGTRWLAAMAQQHGAPNAIISTVDISKQPLDPNTFFMFGSNFPGDGQYGSFDKLISAFEFTARGLSAKDQAALFGETGERVYRIIKSGSSG